MNRPTWPWLLGLCLAALTLVATAQQRLRAPEDLRSLSYEDQVRVISMEYEDQSHGYRIPDDQLQFYLDQVDQSDWGFSRIRADIAQSLGNTPPDEPQGPAGQTVACESFNGQPRICRVPWPGPSRLLRQSSGSQPCIEGQTWQSQTGQVYVGRDCRAVFVAEGATQPVEPLPSTPSVVCSSVDLRPKGCQWPAGTRTPRLLQQLSSQPCEQGRTWGFTGSAIWVSQGCSGRFGY